MQLYTCSLLGVIYKSVPWISTRQPSLSLITLASDNRHKHIPSITRLQTSHANVYARDFLVSLARYISSPRTGHRHRRHNDARILFASMQKLSRSLSWDIPIRRIDYTRAGAWRETHCASRVVVIISRSFLPSFVLSTAVLHIAARGVPLFFLSLSRLREFSKLREMGLLSRMEAGLIWEFARASERACYYARARAGFYMEEGSVASFFRF